MSMENTIQDISAERKRQIRLEALRFTLINATLVVLSFAAGYYFAIAEASKAVREALK